MFWIDPIAIHQNINVNLSDEKIANHAPPKEKHPKSSQNIWASLGMSEKSHAAVQTGRES